MARDRDSQYDETRDEMPGQYDEDEEQTEATDDAEDYGDEDARQEPEDEFDDGDFEDDAETDGEDEEEGEDGGNGEVNDTMYFRQLFGYLNKALQNGTSVPLTTKKLVDTEECFKIIDDMMRNLPDAIQYGWKIYDEKDRILDKAEKFAQAKVTSTNVRAKSITDEATDKADGIVESAQRRAKATIADAEERANAMLEDAAARARKMVNESEVMQRAKSEAGVLLENARADAHERRLKAVNDAYRLLDALEKQTAGISEALSRKKNELIGTDR